MLGAWVWGRGRVIKGKKEGFQKYIMKVLEVMDVLVVVTILDIFKFLKTYQIVGFKYTQLIVCQFYLNKAEKN